MGREEEGCEFVDLSDLVYVDDLLSFLVIDAIDVVLQAARMWKDIGGFAGFHVNWEKSGMMVRWTMREARKRNRGIVS